MKIANSVKLVPTDPGRDSSFPIFTRKEIETRRIRKEIKTIRDPGRDISFPIFIRKEIETRKLERKSKQKNISFNRLIISFKRYHKSLKRYKIEWILKQEKQNKSRKTEKKLKQQMCRLNDFLSFLSNI